MKNYMILSLTISSMILGGSFINSLAFAQNDSANLPGSSANPVVELPNPNKVPQKEISNTAIPEKIKPPLDEECEVKNKSHPSKMKKKFLRKDLDQQKKSQDNNPATTTNPSTGGSTY